MVTYVLLIVVTAFIFDFINGFHDSANSIATIVGTRVLSPFAAVVWAAFFNFVAASAQKIKALEEEGDATYHEAVGELFDGDIDALEVMKWKDLYDTLETALDECEDVANTLESIALKNS